MQLQHIDLADLKTAAVNVRKHRMSGACDCAICSHGHVPGRVL